MRDNTAMPSVVITPNIEDAPWSDLKALHDSCGILLAMGNDNPALRIGGLPRGTKGGKTSVSIAVTLSDGSVVLTETTLVLFLAAADLLRATYPEG